MARYAVVDEASGFVANVVEWDGDAETWQPPSGHIMVEDANGEAGPGFIYNADDQPPFTPPSGGEPGAGG